MGAAITEAANAYANDLLDRLATCQTDAEVVALCQETEKAVMKLQTVNPARFHHVVNLVQLRRADFARAHKKETKKQTEMW
jgi:hypothetical protein